MIKNLNVALQLNNSEWQRLKKIINYSLETFNGPVDNAQEYY